MLDRNSLFSAAATLATHKSEENTPTMGLLKGFKAGDLVFGRATIESVLTGALEQALKGTLEINSAASWACVQDAQRAADLLDRANRLEAGAVPSPIQASEYRAAANRKLIEAASWLF